MLLGAAGCWVLDAGQDGRHFWRVGPQIGRQDLARRDRRICRRVRLHLHLRLHLYLTCIYSSLLYISSWAAYIVEAVRTSCLSACVVTGAFKTGLHWLVGTSATRLTDFGTQRNTHTGNSASSRLHDSSVPPPFPLCPEPCRSLLS